MLKALITTLFVVGTASVAVAGPAVRDHRTAPAYQPDVHAKHRSGPIRPVWTTLGGVYRPTDGAVSFRVSPAANRFTTLRLQSASGKSLIQRVRIQFANGGQQVVNLNRYISPENPIITIDLKGQARNITQVTVVGRNARASSYNVLAI